MSKTDHDVLMALTGLPTAAGCEDQVIGWVRQWVRQRRNLTVSRDRFGNLMIARRGVRSRRPIVLEAHMDHPAFVITDVSREGREVEADFRGGVHEPFFVGTRVRWHGGMDSARGKVVSFDDSGEFKHVTARFAQRTAARPGDVMTWDLPRPRVTGRRLRAPACDDLAGVAAALAAMDRLRRSRTPGLDVRVLLTRAEEIGFVGAIAACGSGIIPKGSRIIALENSKSFDESPIGGGPIIRVGDRTSTFNPQLTWRIDRVAQRLGRRNDGFRWQRKLMPGGTCEATAFQEFGFAATCLCLPLGNYHNMNEATGKIDSEVISLDDFDGLVTLLVATAKGLDDTERLPTLRARLSEHFDRRSFVLD